MSSTAGHLCYCSHRGRVIVFDWSFVRGPDTGIWGRLRVSKSSHFLNTYSRPGLDLIDGRVFLFEDDHFYAHCYRGKSDSF